MDRPIVLAEELRDGQEEDAALDDAEFVRRYEAHRLPVFRYLRSRSPTDEEAADLTAMTFERAWGARHSERANSDRYAAWLFSIARHLAIDAARRRATERRGLLRWPRSEPAPDPATLVLRDESERLLRARLATLPELQREVLLLRFAGGLGAREIGLVVGKREEATQKLITRALGRLKEAYRDED